MALSNGGIIGTDNDPTMADKVTTFNSSGTFTPAISECNLLVVAGAGAGGYAGGGAGGYRAINPHPLPGSDVPVTVGAGGASISPMGKFTEPGVPSPAATFLPSPGSDSVFASTTPITSDGGGGGGTMYMGTSQATWNSYITKTFSGGSGGGGSDCQVGGAGNTPPVSPSQGNPGGDGPYPGYATPSNVPSIPGPNTNGATAGGGGSSAAAADVASPGARGGAGTAGGAGTPNTISGSDVTYAGGGGGSSENQAAPHVAGAGGAGGGGQGGVASGYANGPPLGGDPSPNPEGAPYGVGTAGTANTGGGGGGTSVSFGSAQPSGAGGSGIVIVSEPNGSWTASGVWTMYDQYTYKTDGLWR